MPTPYYVWHGAAGDASGDSWVNAMALIATALNDGAAAAGDIIYVHSGHQETTVGNISWTGAGTSANPVLIISVDKDASDVFDKMVDNSGLITNTNTSDDVYLYGAFVIAGLYLQSFDQLELVPSGKNLIAVDCKFELVTTNNTITLISQPTHTGGMELTRCLFTTAVNSNFNVEHGHVVMHDCIIEATGGGGWSTPLFKTTTEGGSIESYGLDISSLATTIDLHSGAIDRTQTMHHGIKLPTSWTGTVVAAPLTNAGSKIDMYSFDIVNDGYYKFELHRYNGVASEETTIVRTGGSTYDGSILYSMKMVAVANMTHKGISPLRIPLCSTWIDPANPTIQVHFAHTDAGTGTAGDLLDNEFWLEVVSQDATNQSEGRIHTSAPVDLNAAGNDLADDSGAAWGGSQADQQKVSVTVANSVAGLHQIFVCFAPETAETVYVCRKPTIT